MWVSRRLLDANSLIFFCWVPVGMLAGLGFILGCVSLWTIKGPRYQTGLLISQIGQVPKGFTQYLSYKQRPLKHLQSLPVCRAGC